MASNMEADNLPQIALLWEATGVNDFGVVIVSATPVEISVRWNDTTSESSGGQQSPNSKVADVVVDRDIVSGSIMWLGSLDDIPGTSTLTTPSSDFKQVINFKKTPDLKGRYFHRSVSLMNFGDSLPETE